MTLPPRPVYDKACCFPANTINVLISTPMRDVLARITGNCHHVTLRNVTRVTHALTYKTNSRTVEILDRML